jgi:hypothetical protein
LRGDPPQARLAGADHAARGIQPASIQWTQTLIVRVRIDAAVLPYNHPAQDIALDDDGKVITREYLVNVRLAGRLGAMEHHRPVRMMREPRNTPIVKDCGRILIDARSRSRERIVARPHVMNDLRNESFTRVRLE